MDARREAAKRFILESRGKFVKHRFRPPRFSAGSTLSQEAARSKVRVRGSIPYTVRRGLAYFSAACVPHIAGTRRPKNVPVPLRPTNQESLAFLPPIQLTSSAFRRHAEPLTALTKSVRRVPGAATCWT
jgi:hypothetical protein